MIKTLAYIPIFWLFISLFSLAACGESKPETKEEKKHSAARIESSINAVVKSYVETAFGSSTVEYKNIKVDSITPKKWLEMKANILTKQLDQLMEDGKTLKNQIDQGGENRDELQKKFMAMGTEATIKMEMLKAITERVKTAKTNAFSFYLVEVELVITDEKGAVTNAELPFHISREYKILKHPLELAAEMMNENTL